MMPPDMFVFFTIPLVFGVFSDPTQIFLFNDTHIQREREREAETQAEGEAGSMYWEPNVGLNPGSPGSRLGPKAGAKLLCHPGIPQIRIFEGSQNTTIIASPSQVIGASQGASGRGSQSEPHS